MSDGNCWMGTGRLTRDPERRNTPSGIPVCDFTIANNRYGSSGQQYTAYVRCSVWNKRAEQLTDPEKGLKKGDFIQVTGELVDDNFTTTKGDPTTMTKGRLKIDNTRVTIIRRKTPLVRSPETLELPNIEEATDISQ